MPALWLAALLQGLPTVGDTVWVAAAYPVRPGLLVRPRPLAANPAAEPLGPPELVHTDRELHLRYPVVVWRPGRHRLHLPGPVVVRGDGWSDTLPAVSVTIEVVSVLPPVPRDSLVPRPAEAPIEWRSRSLQPMLVLLLLAALPVAALHYWYWRRRAKPGAWKRLAGRDVGMQPAEPLPEPSLARLHEWMRAGEYRAAAEGLHRWMTRLAASSDEAAAFAERLRAARYRADDDSDLGGVCTAAAAWLADRAAR